MPTPGERRALIFFASVAALGLAVRGWREFHPPDSGALAGNRTALARQIEAVDSAIAVSSSKRKPHVPLAKAPRPEPAPRATGARTRASASRDTLPRDPRQAYWDRAAHFDSLNAAPERDFRPAGRRRLPSDQAATADRRGASAKAPVPPVDLDVAGVDEVASVPLIGPALARRIVNDRIENGPFGSITELERIQGLTPAFTRRLAPFVTFSRAPRLGSAGERRPKQKSSRRPGGESRP